MATHLTPEEMKAFVRRHFEDFVNNKKAEVNGLTPAPFRFIAHYTNEENLT
jgi:hypothetical protein